MTEALEVVHAKGRQKGRDTSEQGRQTLLADALRAPGSRESIDLLIAWCKAVSLYEKRHKASDQDASPLEGSTLSELALILTAGFDSDLSALHQKSQTALRSILDLNAFKNLRTGQTIEAGQPPMMADLLGPALQTPQLKRSMLVIEVYIDSFGTRCLGSQESKDSLLQATASALDNTDGLSRRRAAVMLAMLKDSISRNDHSWCPILAQILCRSGEVSRTQVREYILPSLFSLDSKVFHHLGEAVVQLPESVHSQNSIKALLTIWKAASQYGLCSLSGTIDAEAGLLDTVSSSYLATIPASLLEECLLSADDEISSVALAVLSTSKSVSAPISATDLRLWLRYITANISATDPGIRSRILAMFTKLLTRLRTSTYAMARDKGKTRIPGSGTAGTEGGHQDSAYIFLQNLLRVICRNLWPGSPYPAMLSALRLLELLLSSGLDPTCSQDQHQGHTDDPAQNDNSKALRKALRSLPQPWTFHISIVDATLVKTLFRCFQSTFGDIRDLTRDILLRCPSPLPGIDATAEEQLRNSGRRLLLSARASQAEAGIAMLQLHSQLIYRRSFSGATRMDARFTLIQDLLDLAFGQISFVESDGVASAAAAYPVHGCLWALGRLLQEEESSPFPQETEAAKALFDRILKLINKVWTVVQPILCSQAAADASDANNDEETESALPDLELARAISLAGGETSSAREDSEAGVFQHQLVLSYGWRSIKETAALLSALVHASLRFDSALLEHDSVQSIGSLYLEWMTSIRHRGAFSVVYPELSSVASACLASKRQDLTGLPQSWLQQLISDICARDHSFATTRRSAGLSYAVLGLLQAIQAVDPESLTASVKALIQEADRLNEDGLAGDLSRQVHLFNIIRLLVLDSRVGSKLVPITTQLLRLAVSRFQSDAWDLSNVAMLLFSATVNRVFSSRQQHNKDDTMAKPSFATFFSNHPGLSDFFLQQLERLHADETISDVSNGALFTLLAFVTRLQASKVNDEEVIRLRMRSILAGRRHGHNLLDEISAKAYASTVTPQEALPLVIAELEAANKPTTADASLLRAKYLALLMMTEDQQTPRWYATLLSTSIGLLKDLAAVPDSTLVGICNLWRATALISQNATSHSAASADFRELCTRFIPQLNDVIFGVTDGRRISTTRLISATMTLLDLASASYTDAALSSTVLSLLKHPDDAVRNFTLQYLQAEVRTLSSDVAGVMDQIARDSAIGWCERQGAIITLVLPAFKEQWYGDLAEQQEADLGNLLEQVLWEAWETPCVPLRESLLVYASHLLRSIVLSCSADGIAASGEALAPSMSIYATLVRHASDETESLDARLSAVRSLQALDCILYDQAFVRQISATDKLAFNFLQLQLSVLRLADDDDEDVREVASSLLANIPASGHSGTAKDSNGHEYAGILAEGLRSHGFHPQVSKQRALDWLRNCYSPPGAMRPAENGAEGTVKKLLENQLWSQLLPSDHEFETSYKKAFETKTALFAVDAPNQYRNDAENALLYAQALERLHPFLMDEKIRLERLLLRFDSAMKRASSSGEAGLGGSQYILGLRLVLAAQVIPFCAEPARYCAEDISEGLLLKYALQEELVMG